MGNGATVGVVKLYHPAGVLVELPIPGGPFDYQAAFGNVSAALAAGFLVAAPGLEAGEQREEIGYVARKSKDNDRGGTTPVLDLYPANEQAKFAVLSVYLNTPEDVAAFEHASGLKLAALQVYIGDNKIERGKKRELDALVAKAPKPFGVVLIPNPKYDEQAAAAAKAGGKMYTIPKRKFVRWADQKPAGAEQRPDPTSAARPASSATPTANAGDRDPTPAELVADYKFCQDDDEFDRLEALRARIWKASGVAGQLAMKTASEDVRKRLAESTEYAGKPF